jgi:hypothetical protein
MAAAKVGAELTFVMLTLDDADEHRRRLQRRVRHLTHVSELSWDDVLARSAAYAPWAEGAGLHVGAEGAVNELELELMGRPPRS